MTLQRPIRILIAAIVVAWSFDILFWRQSPGISFALFVAVLLIVGFWLAFREAISPARRSLWLLIPIGVFALMTALRLEPMTRFVSVLLTLSLLALIAYAFRSGSWTAYSLSDFGALPFRLLPSLFTGAPAVYRAAQADGDTPDSMPRKSLRSILPVARGLFLALPVVLILGALLVSADPVFSQRVDGLLALFSLERLFEYLFRFGYILILAYFLVGVYLFVLTKSQEDRLIGVDKPPVRPFLGAVEAWIVLGSINILFLTFVIIQFQYFFGGNTNIGIDGLTYAGYARQGFGELVFVAFFSLLLFLALSSLTCRETVLQRRVFSILGIALGMLVGVILISAFQRLLLYEGEYGFTRLRTYPHVFMIWLGITLGAFVVLELVGKTRAFGLVLFITMLGFGLTLGLLNVDRLIAEQNIARAQQGAELDLDYLLLLSFDSTPALVDLYNASDLSPDLRLQVGAVLACQSAELHHELETRTWTGFHFATWRAQRALEPIEDQLNEYQVDERYDHFNVVLDEVSYPCEGRWVLD